MHQIESWVTVPNYNSKTDFILFSNQTYTVEKDIICIRVRNGTILILNKKSVKYSGLFLDYKLSWEQHTKSVVKKLTIARGIISKLYETLCTSVCVAKRVF